MIIDGHLHERVEALYACEEYGIFLLTGQPGPASRRCAYVAAKAFHTMDDDARQEMMKTASPWSEKESCIRISVAPGALSFYDSLTGTSSTMPMSELDSDVQMRLRGSPADPFAKYAGEPKATIKPISVGRPLTLKKAPSA
jgi:isopenicillin N synthase-like dioxygenase